MSLRTFHLVFILLVIVGADLFGAWAIWNYARESDPLLLGMGIAVILGGFGLIVYVWRLVRSFEAEKLG